MTRWKHLLAVVAVAAAAPAPAALAATPHPTTLKGVVVAHESARGTLVVATAKGAVATLRTSARRPVGARVVVRATRLPDGTYRTAAVRSAGAATKARLHGVVVAVRPAQLLLSAGGSVLSVARGRSLAAAGATRNDAQPGDVVNATVTISTDGQVEENGLTVVGSTSLVRLEGTIGSLDASTLVLAVEHGAVTTIAIPSTLTLPSTIVAGDQVEAIAQFSAGAFTLVAIQDDHAAASSASGGSSENDQGQVEAEGTVTAVSATSLTIQPEEGSPIVFAVPSGIDVSAVAVGDRADAKGQVQPDGSILLVRLETHGGAHEQGKVEAEGTVAAVSPTSLTVTTEHGPATFVVPSGIDVSQLQVGDQVHAAGLTQADGTVQLVGVEAQGGGDQGGSSGSGGDH
jgi:hypothetical protein